MRRVALLAMFLLLGSVCWGQFIGFAAQQTVQQTLATNTNCTGSAQTYAINNLGQTQHYLQITNVVSGQSFSAEIDGIDNQGNVYRISDVLEIAGGTITRQGAVRGSGYYPKFQVQVTCSPAGATYTASYSGSQTTNDVNAGTYLTAQIDKTNFYNVSATSNQSDLNEQTPFGTSAGTIFVNYTTQPTTAGDLTISCRTNTNFGVVVVFDTALAIVAGPQQFAVPDFPCPFISVQYTAGTGGTTIAVEYIFSTPGIPNRSGPDPCAGNAASFSSTGIPVIQKKTVPISAAAAATSLLVNSGILNSVYVCGILFSQAATAGTVQFISGSGATCGSGTANVTGAMPVTAGQPVSYGNGGAVIMKTPVSNSLCLTATGAGGTVNGVITYVLSP